MGGTCLPSVHPFFSPLGLRPEVYHPRPEICPFRPEICHLRLQISSLNPQNLDLLSQAFQILNQPSLAFYMPSKAILGLIAAISSFKAALSGRTNESPPVFYRTSSPSGPLPCFPSLKFMIMQSRATGIADHILPLGDWFFFKTNANRYFSLLRIYAGPNPEKNC